MRPTISQYATSLEELSSGATQETVALIAKNFFRLLKRRGDWKKKDAIIKYVEKINAEKEGRVQVTVVSAHDPDNETKEKLSLHASSIFPEKKVSLSYEIHTEMIGGALFHTDEVLYDATLRAQVNNLKKSLLKV